MTSPILYKDDIYLGSVEGSLYKIDSNDGSLVWQYQTEETQMGFTAPISIVDDELFVVGNDRQLYSFSLFENSSTSKPNNNHADSIFMFTPVLAK